MLVAMKHLGLLLAAGIIEGVVGCFTVIKFASTVQTLKVRELLLLDEGNRPAIRLQSVKGRSVLTFLGQDGKVQVEIGVDRMKESRFVNFVGRTGFSTMSLTSGFPNGEAFLALGADYFEGLSVLGAQGFDMPPKLGTIVASSSREWGLKLARPGQLSPVISLIVNPLTSNLRSGIWIEQKRGATGWTAP